MSSSPPRPATPSRSTSGSRQAAATPKSKRGSESQDASSLTATPSTGQQRPSSAGSARKGAASSSSSPTRTRANPPQSSGQQQQQHSRRSSAQQSGSNHGRAGSRSAGGGGRHTPTSASPPPPTSDAMANLKSIISELKDSPAGSSHSPDGRGGNASPSRSRSAGGGQQQHARNSPSQSGASPRRTPSNSHRKSPSSPAQQSPAAPPPGFSTDRGAAPAAITTNTLAPPAGSSTLNPNAGGFHPGALGAITDMPIETEALITPTASSFDLMTGQPLSAAAAALRQNTFGELSAIGAGSNEDDGAYAPSARPFTFPQQQQQQATLQHLQHQQQLQLDSLAANAARRGHARPPSTSGQQGQPGPSEEAQALFAEQLEIQRQLENLRLQQETLLQRFEDMQHAALPGAQFPQATMAPMQPPASAPQPAAAPPASAPKTHRRLQSSQGSNFAAGLGNFGQGGIGMPAGAQPQTVGGGAGAPRAAPPTAAPGGHMRRQSGGASHQRQSSSGAFQNFTFPPAPPGAVQQQQQQGGQPGGRPGHRNQGSMQSDLDWSPAHYGQQPIPTGAGDIGRQGLGHGRKQSSISSLGGWAAMSSGTQANLAEAQQHLQQLAAYRASAGHGRVPSFGLSALGSAGANQLAMASYGGGVPTAGGNQQIRKSLFAPYLPQASIPPLLAAGKLVIGTLRVNKRNRSDAYVATDVLESDIYICGSKDRNRALEGDIVAIELLEVDEVWGTKKEKEEKKRKKEENSAIDPRASRDMRKQDKKKDDVEVEGQGLHLFEDEEVDDEKRPLYAGHVVAVVERAPGQLFSGMLGVLRPSSAATKEKQDAERREREGTADGNTPSRQPQYTPKIIWFRPTDKRVPLIAIPTEQAPADFVHNADAYQDKLFVACIKRWPITSLHPFGTLVEMLGDIGDIEAETNALLKDCNFSPDDFSDAVVKCLPQTPWTIPEHEIEKRRDFRKHRVFSIDPETAKDLDDALHIVKNDDGTFEVGVHIADVSYFVKHGTALDREARKRATTVYLVQKAVPMLPATLCEELCSLVPGVERLAFSTVFQLGADGRILSTWFGKTVISSAAKLAYSDAQEVLEGRSLPEKANVGERYKRSDIEDDIKALGMIARELRAKRFDNGALRIDNVKVGFKLDDEGWPEDCTSYQRREANELIEEFMLLANISVATKIAASLPDQAFLRRHEGPLERRIDGFARRMGRLGITIDTATSGTIAQSIKEVTDPQARFTIEHLATKAMTRAKYFCSGMLDISKYHHFALNVPLYTHFTSPIRRYADVVVHRQLEAILQAQSNGSDIKFALDTEAVAKIASTCTAKKDAARLAQEQSIHLFLCVLIADLTERYGPVVRPATVIGVLDQAFDVVIPEFGIEKRVHVDQVPAAKHVYDLTSNTLQLHWQKGVDVLSWLAHRNNDDHLHSVRRVAESRASMAAVDATTSDKSQAENALFESDDDDSDDSTEMALSTPAGGGQGLITRIKAKARVPKETAQHIRSRDQSQPVFEECDADDCVQTIRELQKVPVVITADLTKSPPVIKVLALNPFK